MSQRWEVRIDDGDPGGPLKSAMPRGGGTPAVATARPKAEVCQRRAPSARRSTEAHHPRAVRPPRRSDLPSRRAADVREEGQAEGTLDPLVCAMRCSPTALAPLAQTGTAESRDTMGLHNIPRRAAFRRSVQPGDESNPPFRTCAPREGGGALSLERSGHGVPTCPAPAQAPSAKRRLWVYD